ncbi:MAG: hypothetical protein Q7U56_10560, partial [Humidesulfovibrio sp.]|nr:hypothetical protein [Humidesulfovibrio sp.]
MKYLLLAVALLVVFPTQVSAQETRKVRLVVQQNGQALVSELRSLTLPKGAGTVLLPDLPTTIDPQTLQVRSRTAPRDLVVRDLTL